MGEVTLEMVLREIQHIERRLADQERNFTREMEDHDRLYMARYEAIEKGIAVAARVAESARDKAETAQKVYDESHNDLLRQMDKQNQAMISRAETLSLFERTDEKIDEVKKEIRLLRDNQTSDRGRIEQEQETRSQSHWQMDTFVGVAIAVALVAVALLAKYG